MNFVRILSGRISAAGGELVPWLMLAAGLVVFVLAAFRSVRLFRTWLASLLGRGNLNDALGMLKHVQSGVDDRANRPRSLNGMERIYLPHIARDFPGLQIDAMGSQAENLLIRSYEALAGGIDPELKADFGPYYYDALTRLITQNEAQGEDRARFEQVKVHQRVLSHYGWREGKRIIEFQFAVEAFMSSPARPNSSSAIPCDSSILRIARRLSALTAKPLSSPRIALIAGLRCGARPPSSAPIAVRKSKRSSSRPGSLWSSCLKAGPKSGCRIRVRMRSSGLKAFVFALCLAHSIQARGR